MIIVKVWCLPKLPEETLRQLHQVLVSIGVNLKILGIRSEADMICLFPQDLMLYGLGTEVLVETTVLSVKFEPSERFAALRLARAFGAGVYQLFPQAIITSLATLRQCYHGDLMNESMWQSNSPDA